MNELGSPLAGIKVISMAEQFPGPLCTLLLAELGADVTLIERPGHGDPQRSVGPWLFRFASRGKRSVTLDLKDPTQAAAARRLIDGADVLVEGFRPGVLDRLGLGYHELSTTNPGLIMCSISGYGQDGPYRTLSGHNVNYEAVTGVLSAYIEAGRTDLVDAPPWGDVISGCLAALGIVATLRAADRATSGTHLDVAISDSLVFAMGAAITRSFNGDEAWNRREGAYGLFECSDGYVALGISHEDHFWQALADELDLGDYRDLDHAERLSRRAEIAEAIGATLRTRTAAHWESRLGETAACSRVNSLQDLVDDPQLRHRGVFVESLDEDGNPFVTVRSPLASRRGPVLRAPGLGEATSAVLDELDATDDGSVATSSR